jgi:hypothetical protein
MKEPYIAAISAQKGYHGPKYEPGASVEEVEIRISQESEGLVTSSRPWAPLSRAFKPGQRRRLCTLAMGILLILYWTVE